MSVLDELRGVWLWLRRRLSGRADSEHEQILIRIVITSLMFVYINLVPLGADAERIIRDSLLIYAFASIASLGLFIHLLARPGISRNRRLCGIATDAIGVNGAMLAGGEMAMFFFPFLLWSVLGHGFRFGRFYLAVSSAMSAVFFIGVVSFTPAWRGFAALDIGLVLSLVMLPAYFALLLGKLERAVTRAEEASRAKSRFLATMSHEFRTPLNAIIGMTDLLRTTRLDAEQRDMAATTRGAAHSLLALVNDVLDIAKIEAGRFTLDEEPFDLHDQLATLRRMLHLEAQRRGLYLRLRVDPALPSAYVGGRGPLHQILVNLTANAIKFTSEGGVLIDVRALGRTEQGVRLRFEVHDTGIGIPAEAQRRIFESFAQAEGDTGRRYGGTGLGLAIAKELVGLLGGRIGVVSAVGQGSSFWVELELKRGLEAAPPSAGPVADGWRGEEVPALVVVLGDSDAVDKATARLARLGIAGIGVLDIEMAVETAVSAGGATAILVVADQPPVDLEALSEALALRRPNEPIDLLTLLPERVEHLALTLADLAETDDDTAVSRILGLALKAGAERGAAALDDLVAARPARVLLVEDNRTNQHVIGKILEHAGHQVAIAESGEACLETLEGGDHDIVLLDLNMPGMSGFDTLKMLRFMLPVGDLPPIVALTADATAETREAALDLGFSAYLTKPIDSPKLLATIDGLVDTPIRQESEGARLRPAEEHGAAGLARRRGPADGQPVAGRTDGALLDSRKIATLLELDAGDGFFAQVVDDYLMDVAQLQEEMTQAVPKGDARAFRDAAHALKSSSAHIGAQGVFECCIGLRDLDDHALLLRAPAELRRIGAEIDKARQALLACRDASRAPQARRQEQG